MEKPKQNRHLAAIMFTDIQGYTALMQQDEEKAIRAREKHRRIFNSTTAKHYGEVLQYYGDGTLSIFKSAIDAVQCGIEMQIGFQEDPTIPVRIGIHTGDIISTQEEIIGDGVNLASRVESLAIPGSVLISEKVFDEIKNQSKFQTLFLGNFELKNVTKLTGLYALTNPGLVVPQKEQIIGGFKNSKIGKPLNEEIRSSKKLLRIGVVIICLLLAGFLLDLFTPIFNQTLQRAFGIEQTGERMLDKSIAVLPFENLSADEENRYFADGQMEAILNHLTKISDLRVISRTTMMGYTGTTTSVPEIAKELGVRYVLEGSVQKSGQKVRINTQLIDSDSDKHLWSENFDRDLTDIFAIQSEIAKNVAQVLKSTLTLKEQTTIEIIPTSDLTAYDFYLKGISYQSKGQQQEDFRAALQMFKKAIERDSSFTLAWVGLASASRYLYWFRYDQSEANLIQTKYYLDLAMTLDPNLMEVQLETANYYYHCKLDYTKALKILEQLKLEYPKNDQLHLWAGAVYRRMGHFEKAYENIAQAISLNPSNWEYQIYAAETLIILKRYKRAEYYFKTSIDLNPFGSRGYFNLAGLYLITGQEEKAKFLLANNNKINQLEKSLIESQVEIMNRNYREAINILESSPHEAVAGQMSYIPKSLQIGLIYYVDAERQLAQSHFEKARAALESKLIESQDDSRIYSSLGIVYAGLGMTEEAITAGNKALSIMNLSIDAWIGFYRELDMARILLMIGEYDEVIPKLEFLLDQNGDLTIELLKNDPFWDPIRSLDTFNALIEKPSYQINMDENLSLE